jgi:hypothetical protein
MQRKRVDSLARIGKLASQMHALDRWRLGAVERERTALGDDLKAVFDAIEGSELAFGPQALFGARHARTLQQRLDALRRESERMERIARAHGVRAKLAERAAETADAVWREKEERKALAELIERTLMRRDASPR